MKYLQHFHYKIQGEDSLPKLVFLHGIMGSANNWMTVASQLPEFQILTFDQRGHGRSFQPETGYSPLDFAEDLKTILDELGWQKISLVGHSMGGRNALAFAQNYAERLEKLVIEDIGPGVKDFQNSKIKGYLDMVPTPFDNKQEARAFFQQEFPRRLQPNPQAKVLANYFYMNIASREDGKADWRFYKAGILEALQKGREVDFWPLVEKLKMPTLWLRGERSTDLMREVLDEIGQINPSIRCKEISKAGHWVHSENTAEFVEVLRGFLLKKDD